MYLWTAYIHDRLRTIASGEPLELIPGTVLNELGKAIKALHTAAFNLRPSVIRSLRLRKVTDATVIQDVLAQVTHRFARAAVYGSGRQVSDWVRLANRTFWVDNYLYNHPDEPISRYNRAALRAALL